MKKRITLSKICVCFLFLFLNNPVSASGQKQESPVDDVQNPEINIAGYIKSSIDYVFTESDERSNFNVNNARLKFSGKLLTNTDYGIQFDMTRKDVLSDAYINHLITPSLSVKLGQYKTPYSTDNLVSSTKIAFIKCPLIKENVSPNIRDRGIQATYKRSYFDIIAAVMNGAGQNKAETNYNKSLALRVVGRIIPQLQVSGNYYTGKNNPADKKKDVFINFGARGKAGGWEYAAEIAQQEHAALTEHSFYVFAAYDWKTTTEYVNMITPAFRIEGYDPDTDLEYNFQQRYTLGVTFNLNAEKYVNRVMLNYEINEDEDDVTVDDLVRLEYMVKF
ncbi:MAG: hypothetical protein HOC71_13715 [Candidatus Latescibacteria bacterium]|nr:hypothetical protein [Candidatus Latescibacterota bacterium]